MSRASARDVAARVIERVFAEDAFLAACLSSELTRADLPQNERALATELAYGVVRTEAYLARRLSELIPKKRPEPSVWTRLLIAAYEMSFLDRVPAHASVSEAVSAARRLRGGQVAGFVNAVLRRFGQSSASRPSLREATRESVPRWLLSKLEASVGAAEAEALVAGRAPSPTLRLARGRSRPPWFEADTQELTVCPGAFRFTAGGDPRARPEFPEGDFVVQELGAQLVAWALGAAPGETILDACAGRGNKAWLLAEQVGPEGHVVATDLYPEKLRALVAQRPPGLPSTVLETRAWDWTKPPPAEWLGHFDAVLVDAPCSGVGTLRRRPEILRRLGATDPARMGALQAEMLRNAGATLRPGGRLVFATCSVLEEEGEGVLSALAGWLASGPALGGGQPGLPFGGASSFRITPCLEGADGYFVASLAPKSP